jgi:hypothetical protein
MLSSQQRGSSLFASFRAALGKSVRNLTLDEKSEKELETSGRDSPRRGSHVTSPHHGPAAAPAGPGSSGTSAALMTDLAHWLGKDLAVDPIFKHFKLDPPDFTLTENQQFDKVYSSFKKQIGTHRFL